MEAKAVTSNQEKQKRMPRPRRQTEAQQNLIKERMGWETIVKMRISYCQFCHHSAKSQALPGFEDPKLIFCRFERFPLNSNGELCPYFNAPSPFYLVVDRFVEKIKRI